MFGGKKQIGDPEAPGVQEHFHKHPLDPGSFGVDAADGLPRPATLVTQEITASPPLALDTFICMADCSMFVWRNTDGTVRKAFEPSEVERRPDGKWYLTLSAAAARTPSPLPSSATPPPPSASDIARFAFLHPVQPVRPQCEHYRRILTDMQGNQEHRALERLCAATRDENGQFVTLNDTRIHACELREPRHMESEGKLDAFDQEAIAKTGTGDVGEFDIDAALAEEGSDGSKHG